MTAILALTFLLTDCSAVGASPDLQLAVRHAERQLTTKGCGPRTNLKVEQKVNTSGRQYFAVAVRGAR